MLILIKKMVFLTVGGFFTSPLYSRDHINCAVRFSGPGTDYGLCQPR